MPSRRERAIARATAEAGGDGYVNIWDAAIHAYEAELAADLESEETVERAKAAYDAVLAEFGMVTVMIEAKRGPLHAALRAALEER